MVNMLSFTETPLCQHIKCQGTLWTLLWSHYAWQPYCTVQISSGVAKILNHLTDSQRWNEERAPTLKLMAEHSLHSHFWPWLAVLFLLHRITVSIWAMSL